MVYICLLFHKSVQSYKKKSIYANAKQENTAKVYQTYKDSCIKQPINSVTSTELIG